MPFLIWLVIAGLILWSYFDPKFPPWITLVVYFIVVVVRFFEKRGNYLDWEKQNYRDEKVKLEETASDFASRGRTFSGARSKAEKKVKDDFEYERNKKWRKFVVDVTNTFFLK